MAMGRKTVRLCRGGGLGWVTLVRRPGSGGCVGWVTLVRRPGSGGCVGWVTLVRRPESGGGLGWVTLVRRPELGVLSQVVVWVVAVFHYHNAQVTLMMRE